MSTRPGPGVPGDHRDAPTTESEQRVRVALVDDNELWRGSLVSALSSRGIEVAADAADADELLDALDRIDRIDVAVLDLRLPPTWSDEGIVLGHTLRERLGDVGIIILSGYEQDVQLRYATRALGDLGGTGGMGYLFKDRVNRAMLKEAVQRVAAGRIVVDPMFSQQAAEEWRRRNEGAADFTPREVEVLDLLAQGLSNKEIADTLYISLPVAERHLTRIFRRMLPESVESGPEPRRDNRRVLAVLEWLRRTGRLRDPD
jgi:DNA-binding NarL/FixJ family response regulator